jgi:hypothetical protein
MGGGSSSCCGRGVETLTVPDGFPPVGFYSLGDLPYQRGVVLVGGPRPIYYFRDVAKPGVSASRAAHTACAEDQDALRLYYIAELLGTSAAALPVKTNQFFSVTWQDSSTFAKRIQQIHQQLREQYEEVTSRLVEAGRLAPAEAQALVPNIEMKIRDQRSDQSEPLPPVELH